MLIFLTSATPVPHYWVITPIFFPHRGSELLNTSAAEEEITLLREELAQLRNEPRGSGVFLADLFGKMESGRFIMRKWGRLRFPILYGDTILSIHLFFGDILWPFLESGRFIMKKPGSLRFPIWFPIDITSYSSSY